jgi:hydrogenase maturation protease
MGDDGIGPRAIEMLHSLDLPHWVRLVDGGTDALVLSSLWQGEPRLWIIDALRRGALPGTVHRLGHDELLAVPQTHQSAHQLSLAECLRLLIHAYPEMAAIRLMLWGVEPATVNLCPELSTEAQEGVDSLIRVLMRSLAGSRG